MFLQQIFDEKKIGSSSDMKLISYILIYQIYPDSYVKNRPIVY